ncbi:MAG: hypothetical protein QM639_16275 [Rhodocyclaceae bacterium]
MATPMEDVDARPLNAAQSQSPSHTPRLEPREGAADAGEPATPDELVGDADEVLEQPGGELNFDDELDKVDDAD